MERMAQRVVGLIVTMGQLVRRVGPHAFEGMDGAVDPNPGLECAESRAERRVVQALNSSSAGSKVCRLFIVDGAEALSKVVRRTYGPQRDRMFAKTAS
jgi:hypothetical protein